MPAIINSDDGVVSGSAGLKTSGANDGITVFQQNGTESMRIDSSGNITVKDKIQFGIDAQTSIQAGGTSDVDLIVAADTNLRFETATNEQARITAAGLLQFNSGYGSVATAYGCRAWVNFNGTGTVAIRASGNVSSITDNGTGNYTVNFTASIIDANYACTVGLGNDSGSTGNGSWAQRVGNSRSTTGIQILCARPDTGALADASDSNVAIFR